MFLLLLLIFHSASSLEILINCTFYSETDDQICGLKDLTILTEDVVVTAISGDNENRSTDNVVAIAIKGLNTITYFPLGLGKAIPKLEQVWLAVSKIKFIKRENFVDMEKLIYLELYINEIESIAEDTFWDLPNLRFLGLASNRLKLLPDNLLVKQIFLQDFSADHNDIEELSERIFAKNVKLQRITMKGAKLTSIKFDFTTLTDIKEIDFSGNKCVDDTFLRSSGDSIFVFQAMISVDC